MKEIKIRESAVYVGSKNNYEVTITMAEGFEKIEDNEILKALKDTAADYCSYNEGWGYFRKSAKTGRALFYIYIMWIWYLIEYLRNTVLKA